MKHLNFGVVYRPKNGSVEVLDYVDPDRLKEVWGVEVAGIKISRLANYRAWDGAVRDAADRKERLFTLEELQKVYENRQAINAAFHKLEESWLVVSYLEDRCWSQTETGYSFAMTINMSSGNVDEGYKKYPYYAYATLL